MKIQSISTALPADRRVSLLDHSLRPIPYRRVWKWQTELVAEKIRSPGSMDTLLLVQHEPVYTLGAGSNLRNLRLRKEDMPCPVIRTERGGEVTYHGPGQLVVYPILDLRRFECDLHWYLRQLEEVVIVALREVSGIEGKRIAGLSGVWVNQSKVAAVGIRAKRWVTYHGIALNVAMDLRPFSLIVPCGIHDRSVTCIRDELEESMDEKALMEEYRFALKEAFQDVFMVELI